jgi:hypothetical protein
MESILGISQHNKSAILENISLPDGDDARQADAMSEYIKSEERKRGLSRTFFEPVDEGEVRKLMTFASVIPHVLFVFLGASSSTMVAKRAAWGG